MCPSCCLRTSISPLPWARISREGIRDASHEYERKRHEGTAVRYITEPVVQPVRLVDVCLHTVFCHADWRNLLLCPGQLICQLVVRWLATGRLHHQVVQLRG